MTVDYFGFTAEAAREMQRRQVEAAAAQEEIRKLRKALERCATYGGLIDHPTGRDIKRIAENALTAGKILDENSAAGE